MGIEHRRATRFDVRLSAELQIDGRTVTGVTRNLSVGGVCLDLDRPIAERAQVNLRLFLVEDDVESEGARGLELMGSVQWVAESDHGHAIGIRFEALTQAQTAALANAVKTLGG
jgi:hypothetical protein